MQSSQPLPSQSGIVTLARPLDRLHEAHVSGSISRTSLMVLEAIVRGIDVGPCKLMLGDTTKNSEPVLLTDIVSCVT